MSLSQYQAYLFDLDGVVWLGSVPIPGVAEAINSLRDAGKKIRFITNNAGQHRSIHCEKLRSMQINAYPEEVISSGYAAARVLARTLGPISVYVMGTSGLEQEMIDAGHTITDEKPHAVVVGHDREFNWVKLDIAFNAIHYHGSRFIACNQDPTYPEHQRLRAGTGPAVAALACAVGRAPDLVIGKPHRPIMEIALESLQLEPGHCVMIGDKIQTDIQAASELGMGTVFVLSGAGTLEDLNGSPFQPLHILESAAELIQLTT